MENLNFGVLTRSTRDLVIVVPESQAMQILGEAGVVPYGVQFSHDPDFLINLGYRLEAFGKSKWTPGGSLSNTLLASASCETLENHKTQFYWLGISEFSDFAGTVSPIDSLRYMFVKPFCEYKLGYLRFTICVISEETKNVICILIYSGDEVIEPSKDWPRMDILMTTVMEVSLANSALYRYICDSTAIALAVADQDALDGATLQRLKELSQLNKLRWIFGHPDEFAKLGFASSGSIVSEFENVEFIGTQESKSVIIWDPVDKKYEHFDVVSAEIKGDTLGAGDAYAGGYLYCRARGGTLQEAHENGILCARRVLSSDCSQIESELNLNKVFGEYIDRRSESKNEGYLFNRIRLTPGFVITSCGQTGIDQLGLMAGSQLGLPTFGVLPKGRRTENSEGVSSKRDNFGDAFIIELGSNSYRYCTWVNAFISDGTLLWDFVDSEGSTETRKACIELGRPLLDVNAIPSDTLLQVFTDWINKHNIRVINIAGNRERLLTSEQYKNALLQIELLLRYAAWHRIQLQTNREVGKILLSGNVQSRTEKEKLRIGVPNSKYERLLVERFLFDKWGIEREHPRKLHLWYPTESLELVFTRARDLPTLLQERAVDIIFCGDDLLTESGIDFQICLNTGLQSCYIALIGRKDSKSLDNLRVGSQYPNLSAHLLRESGLSGWSLRPLLGSAEAWINSDIIDAAIDTWRTGYTATINDLALLKVFNSTYLVIAVSDLINSKKRRECLEFAKIFESWLSKPSNALIKYSL